jgi:hypothetical protein
MFWLAGALPAYWLLQQHNVPSISKKFLWTVAAPVSLWDVKRWLETSPNLLMNATALDSCHGGRL